MLIDMPRNPHPSPNVVKIEALVVGDGVPRGKTNPAALLQDLLFLTVV
jgi:hypothetical protein